MFVNDQRSQTLYSSGPATILDQSDILALACSQVVVRHHHMLIVSWPLFQTLIIRNQRRQVGSLYPDIEIAEQNMPELYVTSKN